MYVYIDTSIVSNTGRILSLSGNYLASATIMPCAALATSYLSLAVQRNNNVCSEPIFIYRCYSDVVKICTGSHISDWLTKPHIIISDGSGIIFYH